MHEFDWNDLKLFLAVARAGGLGPAARMSGKSAPTLGRRMLELERALGQELFLRKPRGYDLTECGSDLLVKVESIGARIFDLIDDDTPPLVKISAGTWVTQVLVKAVDQFVGTMPVRVRFIAGEEIADIGRREAVIGIRNFRPEGIGLAGRKIGIVGFAAYARDNGISKWAHVISSTPSAAWVKENSDSKDAIEVTTPQSALDLAIAGAARAVLPIFIGEAQPGLIAVSNRIKELDHEQWLVTHHEDRYLPEVRHLIDQIYVVLRENCTTD